MEINVEMNKAICAAFAEGVETARFEDRITAGDIHEIEEWIDEDNDNRSTRI